MLGAMAGDRVMAGKDVQTAGGGSNGQGPAEATAALDDVYMVRFYDVACGTARTVLYVGEEGAMSLAAEDFAVNAEVSHVEVGVEGLIIPDMERIIFRKGARNIIPFPVRA